MKLKACNRFDLNEIITLGRKTYYDTFHLMNTEETMSKYLDEAFAQEN